MTETPRNVYQLIAEITAKMSKEGISKDRKNQQQGYSFRGIDDIYNVLGSMLGECGLVIIPRMTNREVTERVTQKGGTIFYVVADMEYDLISSHDGTKHVAKVMGEAMDSADKATNKAMSAAYKYLCLQTFCIPTEGDNDADGTTQPAIKPKDTVRGGTTAEQLSEEWPLEARKKVVDDLIGKLLVVTEDKIKEARTYTKKIIKNLEFVGSIDLAHELSAALEGAEIELQQKGLTNV